MQILQSTGAAGKNIIQGCLRREELERLAELLVSDALPPSRQKDMELIKEKSTLPPSPSSLAKCGFSSNLQDTVDEGRGT